MLPIPYLYSRARVLEDLNLGRVRFAKAPVRYRNERGIWGKKWLHIKVQEYLDMEKKRDPRC